MYTPVAALLANLGLDVEPGRPPAETDLVIDHLDGWTNQDGPLRVRFTNTVVSLLAVGAAVSGAAVS